MSPDDDMMPVFGRVLTAMVTPMTPDGREVDYAQCARLAAHLVDDLGHDGLVVNGTTGESPTTSDVEKRQILDAVVTAVGDRASIVAGVGTFSTAHTVDLAQQAASMGADGLLVVTPYYSRPPADALEAHFVTVADSTDLPVMLYDIPHRSGIPIPEDMLIRLDGHPRIRAVKDAKANIVSTSTVLSRTNLAYYAGDDAYLLPLLAVGGVGVVGTSTHFTAPAAREIIEHFLAGRVAEAIAANQHVLPAFQGVFATQGCMMVKAGLGLRGFDVGPCRAPMGRVADGVAEAYVGLLENLGFAA
ncbi:4-hydroxy-tetrahydrodipicolinate synthase [Tessaracoccus sp. MC1865]|uniref:4-hydroxy-tetrahydrodipicolinate synthase n=1 Tax=unclassified Tessaracoccus TaxID=2635419 RepID=UPI001603A3AE|nr:MULTISPECIES: 4-hydroxy-tetrahydrodipicolinate synthase [unclassified Tessaracoccus]MBB1482289.1 4-hydroxy-tetrahydrodipicolinate synthase [Tessaracoccus sp. MC1865]MBB1509534.1 4-hydroxy-tetrahydrodipicolinate synthase [Tessaracoccus sp. MC1756]QTO38241.1 4-hydroxy-tetrahydrodipicolinate synthase [Tessaracoccus sp. MC1865]